MVQSTRAGRETGPEKGWPHGGDILHAASLDEGLRRPLVVDNEQVIIKGVLLPHRLRPAPPSA